MDKYGSSLDEHEHIVEKKYEIETSNERRWIYKRLHEKKKFDPWTIGRFFVFRFDISYFFGRIFKFLSFSGGGNWIFIDVAQSEFSSGFDRGKRRKHRRLEK